MSLTETPPLQLILPTDKRNPSLSLYLSADERAIHVFYGLELLEVVPADRAHVAYKPSDDNYTSRLTTITFP